MNDLPRGPMPPVPPPIGSFEQTVGRARARRRKAMAGVASASAAACAVVAVAATISIGHRNTGSQPLVPIAPTDSSPTATAPSPTPIVSSPTPSPVVTSTPAVPVVSPSISASLSSASASSPPASVAPPLYRGRLTDAAHHPLKGYRIYWNKYAFGIDGESNTINIDHPAAISRADGTFSTACPAAGMSLVIPPKPLTHDARAGVRYPAAGELSIMQIGDLMVARMIDPSAGCRPGAAVTTTVFRPHAVVTGTLFFDGKRYDAAMAAGAAAAQPGDSGETATLFVEIPAPSGEIQMDGVFPDPATGTFTISGLGSGEVAFLFYYSRVTVPVVDGQPVRVEVRETPGTAPDAHDAMVTVTVVP